MSINESLKAKFDSLAPHLNERLTRLWAATEAIALGRGGITEVSGATGLSPKTIRVGIRELDIEPDTSRHHTRVQKRIRGIGGGRKRKQDIDPALIPDLKALIEECDSRASRITNMIGHLKALASWRNNYESVVMSSVPEK